MTVDWQFLLKIVAALALAYGAVRFVLLPLLGPKLIDAIGRKSIGPEYEKARRKGASFSDAITQGLAAQRDKIHRDLAFQSGVPLEFIRGFHREFPRMSLRASVFSGKDGVTRYRVDGDEAKTDGYPGESAFRVYHVNGSVDEEPDASDDAVSAEMAVRWESLPERIRLAADKAVPGGAFVGASDPDDEEPYYEIELVRPDGDWIVEVETDGTVRRAIKRLQKP